MWQATFLLPIAYTLFLWWFTTGIIMAIYKRSQRLMRISFGVATVILCAALIGVYITRNQATVSAVYIAVTCGVLVWGWQVASYYLGIVTGPGHTDADYYLNSPIKPQERNLKDRFRLALHFTLYHELVVIGFGIILAGLTLPYSNRWGLWIYLTLWLMHSSAKLNVFLGVRNFQVDVLPKQLRYLESVLTTRTSNSLFPFTIILSTSIGLAVMYQGIAPSTLSAQRVGFLFVGTMITLGVIEHWMLVLPLPSTLVGFNIIPTPQPATTVGSLAMAGPMMSVAPVAHATAIPTSTGHSVKTRPQAKRTYTFDRDIGPLVVDVWDARYPADVNPILLIHGWGSTGNYWNDTAFKLSHTARVIVPDLPGTGRSQPVSHGQTMYDQVDTLDWLMDELTLSQVQIVSHSMGGAMGLLLAQKAPERVERIVLTSLSFFMTRRQEIIYKAAMDTFQLSLSFRPPWLANVPFMPQLMASRYFYNVPEDEALLAQGLRDYLALDAATAMACARNATDSAIPEAGAALQAPALLIACRQDDVMPMDNVMFTVNTIPQCDVHWIDGSGHLPMIEKPDEYMKLLTGFLNLD
jgi:putative photosynthetic complex assembly protein 2